jgi:hypothetical protein
MVTKKMAAPRAPVNYDEVFVTVVLVSWRVDYELRSEIQKSRPFLPPMV